MAWDDLYSAAFQRVRERFWKVGNVLLAYNTNIDAIRYLDSSDLEARIEKVGKEEVPQFSEELPERITQVQHLLGGYFGV